MDAKEQITDLEAELQEIKKKLLTLSFATAKEQQIAYDIVEQIENRRIKQARNDALEEAAKVAEFCLEINAIKSFEVMNFTLANFVGGHISKAIRALKEK